MFAKQTRKAHEVSGVHTKLVLTRASFPKENLAEVGFIRPSLSFPFLLKEKMTPGLREDRSSRTVEIIKEGKTEQTEVCFEGTLLMTSRISQA